MNKNWHDLRGLEKGREALRWFFRDAKRRDTEERSTLNVQRSPLKRGTRARRPCHGGRERQTQKGGAVEGTYDPQGRLLGTAYSDGTRESDIWACCLGRTPTKKYKKWDRIHMALNRRPAYTYR